MFLMKTQNSFSQDASVLHEEPQELGVDKLELHKIKEYVKTLFISLFKISLWMVIFISFYQLLFGIGGIIDYQRSCNDLAKQETTLKSINEENKNLIDEMQHMEDDPIYQKKLIREHLGVIAKDEYVVLGKN